MIQETTKEFHSFTNKLILSTVCTVMLWSALQSLIQTTIGAYFSASAGWALSMVEIIFASAGLYWINRDGGKNNEAKRIQEHDAKRKGSVS